MTKRKLIEIVACSTATIAICTMAGCGSGPPAPAEPMAAREALDRALGAWKDGKSAESLKSDNPAIVVSDHLWNKGAPLIKYEIEKGDHRNGANQRFKVVLWFKDEKGKEKKEKTEYDVGTDPVITVVRPF